MKTIVHFGMDKTGSSSIQESLYRNEIDHRFHYLDVNKANASEAVGILFYKNAENRDYLKLRGVTRKNFSFIRENISNRLTREMSLAQGKTAILSAELIWTLERDELLDLLKFLTGRGAGPVMAVGYVRSPKAYIESGFQQRCKSFEGCAFSQVSTCWPSYRVRCETFDKVFDRESLSISKFDPALFLNGDVVLDFCSRIGMNFPRKNIVRVNESLSVDAVRFFYTFHRFFPRVGYGPNAIWERRLMRECLANLKGSRFSFHSRIISPILEEKERDIKWMEERLGQSLQEDITKDDDIAIACEEDLFQYSSHSLHWLREQLGAKYTGALNTSEDVGSAMNFLRQKLADDNLRPIGPLKDVLADFPRLSFLLENS